MDRMTGFPTEEESRVMLANWQDPPSVRWAFRHMRELIPSQNIPAGPTPAVDLPRGEEVDLAGVTVERLSGATTSVDEVFDDTSTDAVVLMHDGVLLNERYYADSTDATPHLVMSVSKSIVGCVAGILAGRGLLDVTAPVEHYVAEVAESGYGRATVRDLLDMRTGVQFRETYDAPDAEVRVMERSMGWRPRLEGDPVGAYAYLASLERAEPHGGTFTYRSADTDMLGWVCERAAGTRMADLIATLLWQPMGAERDAEITCDSVGTGIHDGGISTVPRDLARFGRLLLDGGMVDGNEVIPASWLEDSWDRPDDVRAAFADSDNEDVLPGGWYRNQFWFVPKPLGTALVCLGIHGQMVYVNRETRLVGVKVSSWPTPQHTPSLVDTLRAFGAIGAHLATQGEPSSSDPGRSRRRRRRAGSLTATRGARTLEA
jgi:CubicO group peptidase (beta-lactamase class C family)